MDNRRDVQEYLTALRARLTPETAGLTIFGGERRVPGLRREEVAQLAGVSTAYYTRMERGDLSGVSDSVLYALARGLQLNEAETTHLLDLARAAAPSSRQPRRNPVPKVPARLAQLFDAMPDVPVVSLSRIGDPLASNLLGRALFPHLFPENGPTLNHARYLFLDPRSRQFYPDWETSARGSVASMRLLAGQDPTDRALMSLVGELSTHSNEFRGFWSSHTVRLHTSSTKRINHPVVGEMTLGYDVLAVASVPGLSFTTYQTEPATPSADALQLLRNWVADARPRDAKAAVGSAPRYGSRDTPLIACSSCARRIPATSPAACSSPTRSRRPEMMSSRPSESAIRCSLRYRATQGRRARGTRWARQRARGSGPRDQHPEREAS